MPAREIKGAILIASICCLFGLSLSFAFFSGSPLGKGAVPLILCIALVLGMTIVLDAFRSGEIVQEPAHAEKGIEDRAIEEKLNDVWKSELDELNEALLKIVWRCDQCGFIQSRGKDLRCRR